MKRFATILALLVAAPLLGLSTNAVAAEAQTAEALAAIVARATFQPDRAVSESARQFEKEFDAGTLRGAAGRTITPTMRAYLDRAKAAGRDELVRQLRTDAVPKVLGDMQRFYVANFSRDELEEMASFWTSPAGLAWTAAIQATLLNGGGTVVAPPEHARAISRYMNSAISRKEASLYAAPRAASLKALAEFMQRIRPKLDAAMRSVERPKS